MTTTTPTPATPSTDPAAPEACCGGCRPEGRGPSRRTLLRGAAVAGVAGAAGLGLAACSSDNSGSGSGGSQATSADLGAASAIPVGGGKIFADQKVVVTQPEAGTYKAFSAVCTHQGCTVGTVADGLITCPCHGSQFKIADGSVANGPATDPLPAEKLAVQGGKLIVGG